MDYALSVEGVVKRFGGVVAVDQVTFDLAGRPGLKLTMLVAKAAATTSQAE